MSNPRASRISFSPNAKPDKRQSLLNAALVRNSSTWESNLTTSMYKKNRERLLSTMEQGNTYQKLEAIFANISVRHLSEIEAQRRLRVVMRAALKIQMRARKWIVQARAKIEQEHKITCRSEYAFSSNEPPDHAAARASAWWRVVE